MDTSGFDENLAGPGTVDGTTYGVPIGANTLGLYYNADILTAAGVDPAQHHGLGLARRGAEEGDGGRLQGHHLLRDHR